MPHVVVQYTANLDPEANIGALCKALAEVIVAQRDAAGGPGTVRFYAPIPIFSVGCTAAAMAIV